MIMCVKIATDLLHQGMIDEKTALLRCEPNKLDELLHFALGNGISRRKNQHPFPTREAILPISQIVKIGRPWPT